MIGLSTTVEGGMNSRTYILLLLKSKAAFILEQIGYLSSSDWSPSFSLSIPYMSPNLIKSPFLTLFLIWFLLLLSRFLSWVMDRCFICCPFAICTGVPYLCRWWFHALSPDFLLLLCCLSCVAFAVPPLCWSFDLYIYMDV